MQFTVKTAMAVLAFCAGLVQADQCAKGSVNDGGNFYCQPVKAITYSNVGHSGSYNKVTSMTGGACSSEPVQYSGSLAPLDEEVSLHFRGPMKLKKVAAYTKSGGSSKRSNLGGPHARRHGHSKFHEKKEAKPDTVTATIDGKVATWENDWFGPGGAPAATKAPANPAQVAGAKAPVAQAAGVKAAAPKVNKHEKAVDPNAAYSRVGFYDAESGSADGIVFLGNYGGQGSGTFDSNYGNSLSYLNADGNGGASSPNVLSNKLIGSNEEFTIMTDRECSGDDCGYVRPGTVAYHGFDGADKIFMFEFEMPHDSSSGFNGDMPAIWMLNAQIPRTLQYGEASCSCWGSGCGEFDIIEVLSPGEDRCKSTLHTNAPGGSSDYLVRPTDHTMKLAMIMNSADGTINVVELPDSASFSGSLSASEVNSFLSAHSGDDVSQFSIAA